MDDVLTYYQEISIYFKDFFKLRINKKETQHNCTLDSSERVIIEGGKL